MCPYRDFTLNVLNLCPVMIIVYLCLQIKSVKPLFLFLMVESGSCATTPWIRPQSVPTDQSDAILETPHFHGYF